MALAGRAGTMTCDVATSLVTALTCKEPCQGATFYLWEEGRVKIIVDWAGAELCGARYGGAAERRHTPCFSVPSQPFARDRKMKYQLAILKGGGWEKK